MLNFTDIFNSHTHRFNNNNWRICKTEFNKLIKDVKQPVIRISAEDLKDQSAFQSKVENLECIICRTIPI